MRPTTKHLAYMRSLIARPGGWVKGVERQRNDRTGKMSYCLVGAHRNAATVLGGKGQQRAWRLIREAAPIEPITFNDQAKTRKKDVLAVLDRAIELSQR